VVILRASPNQSLITEICVNRRNPLVQEKITPPACKTDLGVDPNRSIISLKVPHLLSLILDNRYMKLSLKNISPINAPRVTTKRDSPSGRRKNLTYILRTWAPPPNIESVSSQISILQLLSTRANTTMRISSQLIMKKRS
jgi:hypothetical protein